MTEDEGEFYQEWYVGDSSGGVTFESYSAALADYLYWKDVGIPGQDLMVRKVTEYEVLEGGL